MQTGPDQGGFTVAQLIRRREAPRLARRTAHSMVQALGAAQRKLERVLEPDGRTLTPYVSSVAQAYETRFETCPCVFVLSTGRVGTETLTALLAQARGVSASHEPRPALIRPSYDAYISGVEDERWRDVVLAARGEAVAAAAMQGRVYVETNNRMTYLAWALAEAFPASKFIHLHRHPYDVVYSGLRRGWYGGHPWDHARIRPRDGDPLSPRWHAMSQMEKVAWYWCAVNSLALDFMRSLSPERAMDLRSSDLFAGDDEVLARLFGFVGVEVPEPWLIEEVMQANLNRQVGGATIEPPSRWSAEQRRAVNAIVRDVAGDMGYELSEA